MSLVMLETNLLPENGLFKQTFDVTANIQVTASKAQQLVTDFVVNQIADSLRGDKPDLMIRSHGTYWQVPVVISSASWGQIGVVDVDVEHGNLQVTEQDILKIKQSINQYNSTIASDNKLLNQQLDEMNHLKILAQQVANAWTSPKSGLEILAEMREA